MCTSKSNTSSSSILFTLANNNLSKHYTLNPSIFLINATRCHTFGPLALRTNSSRCPPRHSTLISSILPTNAIGSHTLNPLPLCTDVTRSHTLSPLLLCTNAYQDPVAQIETNLELPHSLHTTSRAHTHTHPWLHRLKVEPTNHQQTHPQIDDQLPTSCNTSKHSNPFFYTSATPPHEHIP